MVNYLNGEGRLVSAVRLNSPGGLIAEGVRIADVIKTAKLATVVPNGWSCASACFIAFAAGAEKYVSYQAQLGVHGASDARGVENGDATVAMAKIVKELGVPSSIIGRMVVTPPSEIVWLTPDELQAMGTKMTGKPAQLAQPAFPTSPSGQPMQLPGAVPPSGAGAAGATATKKIDWQEFYENAVNKSAQQNGGRPQYGRSCQPEFKICNTGLVFKSEKGLDIILKVTEDMNGKLVQREVCMFNAFGDVRDCVDWDTGAEHKDMKNDKGDWRQVN